MSKIPKIIHQLWIGPKSPPTKLMDTWKNQHEKEGFEYIRWTEQEMNKRGFQPKLMDKVNEMEEINGKADILRWELLYEYGGFFVDADGVHPFVKWIRKFGFFPNFIAISFLTFGNKLLDVFEPIKEHNIDLSLNDFLGILINVSVMS